MGHSVTDLKLLSDLDQAIKEQGIDLKVLRIQRDKAGALAKLNGL